MSEAATVASALDVLSSRYSVIGDYRRYVRVAVNAAYAEDDRALSPGDELALITPVSGG
jgi:molybdopterin converting factor small subunit